MHQVNTMFMCKTKVWNIGPNRYSSPNSDGYVPVHTDKTRWNQAQFFLSLPLKHSFNFQPNGTEWNWCNFSAMSFQHNFHYELLSSSVRPRASATYAAAYVHSELRSKQLLPRASAFIHELPPLSAYSTSVCSELGPEQLPWRASNAASAYVRVLL